MTNILSSEQSLELVKRLNPDSGWKLAIGDTESLYGEGKVEGIRDVNFYIHFSRRKRIIKSTTYSLNIKVENTTRYCEPFSIVQIFQTRCPGFEETYSHLCAIATDSRRFEETKKEIDKLFRRER
jgi:hypothetical protein